MTHSPEHIIVETTPGSNVATIILSRPEKHNSLNERAQLELMDALATVGIEKRVVIITGAGEKAFCTGVDLTELPDQQRRSQSSKEDDVWLRVCMRMLDLPCVFIAAVNGYALGGGLTLVNLSDLAIASEGARFGMPELGFGAFPRLSGPATARRLLPKHVNWLALTAERVDAPTALQWGLVNEVVSTGALIPRAQELAERLTDFDPVALAWTRRGLAAIEGADLRSSLEFGAYVRAMVMAERSRS